MNGLIGQKINQGQAFLADGRRIPLSMISVSGNVVTQVKTMDTDHYSAVQIGFGKKNKLNKPTAGHIKKAGKDIKPRFFHEFRVDDTTGIELGAELKIEELFEPGDVINVTGTSKGKGYAGVVKRHGFRGGPRTHGQSDRERAPGSIGQTTTPGRVYKGKRMSGRMGNETVTVKNLVVVDVKDGILYVKGLVPGIKGGMVVITKAEENKTTKAMKKNFTPLFKVQEEVTEEAGPVVETVEVEALPESPEEAVEEQVAEQGAAQEESAEAQVEEQAKTVEQEVKQEEAQEAVEEKKSADTEAMADKEEEAPKA